MKHKLRSHPLSYHIKPEPCPDPLCLLDLQEPVPCPQCPQNGHNPGWGGHRPGAGAPRGNLNSFKDGSHSKQLQRAIDKIASDPELRPLLLFFTTMSAKQHRYRLSEISQGVQHEP